MSLRLTHEKLGWPSRSEILTPSGEGARVFAELAQAKIGSILKSAGDSVGILTANSKTSTSEPPLAVVCETQRRLSEHELRELQRLGWNFSRSPMLVTVEPDLLRVWTCCKQPKDDFLTEYIVEQLNVSDLSNGLSQRAAQILHWVNLVSGQFFKTRAEQFRRDQRADQTLLDNLNFVRKQLRNSGLTNDDVCHDLLARIVFIQFLFDRKDSSGYAALNTGQLERLYEEDVLKERHDSFASILSNYHESYRFFYWLDERFNGDLFPQRNESGVARDQGWQAEKRLVNKSHLEILSDLVAGNLHLPTGQRLLWRDYSFDAIPLEFVSTILEAFIKDQARSSGIYFTPPHLVDFTLDQVLPWGGKDWNLKVLDPACGSGVFLVKAFQRLVNRWKNAHPNEAIRTETLRGLLENNLFGVDTNPHAVRVASYNLYLAMCDEIDPRYYWTRVRFPPMRERRLIHGDFFTEDTLGFHTQRDSGTYDLVVGNAPWGEKLLTQRAKGWAQEYSWPVADKGIGSLFLPKAAWLTKDNGRVAMIQSASSLLFNRSGPSCDFRQKLFTQFNVKQIVNLSALRFHLFKKRGSAQKTFAPPCVIVLSPKSPNGERLTYISPKAVGETTEPFEIIIEPNDVKQIHPVDAASDPNVWVTLMWGNERDRHLIRWLSQLPSLETLRGKKRLDYGEGLIRGNREKRADWLLNRPILEGDNFPDGTFLSLRADQLPRNKDSWAERPRTQKIFSTPQLLIKQSWTVGAQRYQARLVIPDQFGRGAICSQSFLSVVANLDEKSLLEAACLVCNSSLAVYFLLLTSGRFASYRPEALAKEIPRIPIIEAGTGLLDDLKTTNDVDRRIRQILGLKPAEWVLIEDLCQITLRDFKEGRNAIGRRQTRRQFRSVLEPELESYCIHFIRVIQSAFGHDKQISATIFQESDSASLPFRLVAFQFGGSAKSSIEIEPLKSSELLNELEMLNKTWLKGSPSGGSIYYRRVARIYDHRFDAPTIFIIKPDAVRYWTRSVGLHDGDEVTADFTVWQTADSGGQTK